MAIPYADCDFSPMKQHLKDDLEKLISRLQRSIQTLDEENHCMLGEIEGIKENFLNIESRASTFYLNCYLSPFTDKYTELSVSVQNLSKRRHGALIVVQRNDSLDGLIQPGVNIGASVTQSLLESLFYPGTPLHDGAVLIKFNEIVSAKNILPLSHIVQAEPKLGTRHRAAIGITELSDAIVLVVSEETGRVSFASRGYLYPVVPR
ncbi:sporulation-specific diadenylate cyclase CdaS [Paenibacillus sp. 1P03SA]|uniref:sporulation-specific diadenylate cyclase CdaS n=1 Tax=Paenibacillus sp. 1P03SA TaxID=3132294 RepID=UPI0039A3491D